jgi:hypothetical protein
MEVMNIRLDKQFMKRLGYKRVDEPIKMTKEKYVYGHGKFSEIRN